MTVEKVLHSGRSDFQSVELIESGPFGKVSDTQGGCAACCTVDGPPFALPVCRTAELQTMHSTLGVRQTDMCNAASLLRLSPSACWAALTQPAQ